VTARLEMSGPLGNSTVQLGDRVVYIGRSAECDICLEDPSLAAIAVKISPLKKGHQAQNLKNSTRILLNGKKFKKAFLADGDSIRAGDSTLRFETVAARAPGSARVKYDHAAILAAITRFADEVAKERNLKKLLGKIIDTLMGLLGGTDAFIFTLNREGKPEVFVSSRGKILDAEFSDTVVQEVIRSGTAACIPNALADPKYSGSRSIADLKLNTVLCCPIVTAGQTGGVIYLGARATALSFTTEDLDILKIFASVAGMLINHVGYIQQQNEALKKLSAGAYEGIVAQSPRMREVIRELEAVAPSDIAILLQGETGTGKDLLAQLAHDKSRRAAKKFVVVNCSTLKGDLLESELFGHVKGAFTGAIRDHCGLFREADGGTVFMDEIGDMDVSLQAKLLRTLETGKVRSVGSATESSVDVRVICATHRDLKAMVARGAFREDLFYRLCRFNVHIPPLRERGEDIVLLAYHYLEKYKALYPEKEIIDFENDTLCYIKQYSWPGNVRELSNAVQISFMTNRGPLLRIAPPGSSAGESRDETDLEKATLSFQRQHLSKILMSCGGDKDKAAGLLGVSRSTFYRILGAGGQE
jgi:two-component system response regulator HydG